MMDADLIEVFIRKVPREKMICGHINCLLWGNATYERRDMRLFAR